MAALILSVNPNLTNLEVKRILYRSAHDLGEPGWDEYYGWGRVDARAAVEMALNLTPLYVDDNATNDPGPGDPNISDPNENGSVEHPFDSIQKAIEEHGDFPEVIQKAEEIAYREFLGDQQELLKIAKEEYSEAHKEVTRKRKKATRRYQYGKIRH